jgi:PHD/YefM family antitoxin component YafN of YafNO toxin-antitoxin module
MIHMPELLGISELRLRQNEVLQKLKEGPILLAQRSQAVAVMVSPEMWNEMVERIEDLQDALAVAQARAGDEPTMDLDDYLASRGECV